MEILATVFCPYCQTGVPVWEFPSTDSLRFEIEALCPVCEDTFTTMFTIEEDEED